MEEIKTEQRESVKLMKMSKGYQWEIKLHLHDPLMGKDGSDLIRLKEIDAELVKTYTEI